MEWIVGGIIGFVLGALVMRIESNLWWNAWRKRDEERRWKG